ncbi:MAG: hypothetical protein JNJ46_07330 [Myxococcales bacterium]|nr:hypothetical protein [Myxococcales bacterium]
MLTLRDEGFASEVPWGSETVRIEMQPAMGQPSNAAARMGQGAGLARCGSGSAATGISRSATA